MAHDSQIAREPGDDSAASSNGRKTASRRLSELSAIVADWLTLYAQVYREEVTEEMALLYQKALDDLRPEILHKAFLRAAKHSKFRPTPAEVREAANVEMDGERKGTAVNYPEVSQAERDAALVETEGQRTVLRSKLGLRHDPRCLCQDCRDRRNNVEQEGASV